MTPAIQFRSWHNQQPVWEAIDLPRLLRNLNTVTHYFLTRRRYPRRITERYPHMRADAEAVQSRLDVDALARLLDYLSHGVYPPIRVGAAGWELGGFVLSCIRENQAQIRELMA
jgi:hypothetical protein